MKTLQEKNHKIIYGSKEIEFELEYRDRKTMEISVYPDFRVLVRAPMKHDFDTVINKVEKKAKWIVKQKEHFANFYPKETPRKYVSGESYRYLGKQYRLKIVKAEIEDVKLKRGYLFVFIKNKKNKERIKTLIDNWYLNHARKKFSERLLFCYKKFKKYGIPYPEIQIRRMSKRWGSFTKSGKIILNSSLIKVPSYLIDYVITHELCHAKYYSHNKAFYKLLTEIMPDWKARKGKLEKFNY